VEAWGEHGPVELVLPASTKLTVATAGCRIEFSIFFVGSMFFKSQIFLKLNLNWNKFQIKINFKPEFFKSKLLQAGINFKSE
jgi:hypothetical protein